MTDDIESTPKVTDDETAGHIALSQARQTEEAHLATTNQQLAEWELTVRNAEAKIRDYRDGIEGQRTVIQDAKRQQSKLRKKRLIFRRAAFALEIVEQEG